MVCLQYANSQSSLSYELPATFHVNALPLWLALKAASLKVEEGICRINSYRSLGLMDIRLYPFYQPFSKPTANNFFIDK